MSSINKVMLLGNVGSDPDVRTVSGKKMASFTMATSDTWRDRQSGEKKEKTEWHRVVVFNEALAGVVEKYVRKGSKVAIFAKQRTRKWQKDGQDHYTTENVIENFAGELTLLDSKSSGDGDGGRRGSDRDEGRGQNSGRPSGNYDDSEIPF